MKTIKSAVSGTYVVHKVSPNSQAMATLIQMSKISPGLLWVGGFRLNRTEVKELIGHLQYWLENKCLREDSWKKQRLL